MTLSGPCVACGAPLASDQHHCVICGLPTAAVVPAAPATIETGDGGRSRGRGIPLPPQAAILASVLALGFGGVIGSALSPAIDSVLAAVAAPIPAESTQPASADVGDASPATGRGGGEPDPAPAATPASTPTTPVSTLPPTTTPIAEDPVEEPIEEDPPAEDPLPPDDETTEVSGTVVRVNPNAQSYSLASGGVLSTVHAKDLPKPGTEVTATTETLLNGTLGEAGKREESGAKKEATFSGTVTFADEELLVYVLSSPGASIPISVPAPSAGEKPDMPALAASVTVDVEISPAPEPISPRTRHRRRGHGRAELPIPIPPPILPPAPPTDPAPPAEPPFDPTVCTPEAVYPPEPADPGIVLTQKSYFVDFETLASTGLEGIVQAVCPDLDRIVLSADDLRETGQDLTLSIPKDVDPSKVKPGDSISTNVDPTPAEDGAVAVTGLAGDDGARDADDAKLAQGDKEQ